ncbi:MAG: C39 family peptidase [Chloroflexia bacterium]|nr:C39 family peptidase [Chloroflexia bacterium]
MRRYARLVGAWVVALPLLLGPMLGSHQVIAQSASAKGWLTISSTTPAAGCWLDGSVEVRRDGVAVPDVEVGVSLVHGGEVVGGDRGVTGADGFTWLGFDMGGVPVGGEAWVDVLMGGVYAGGLPLSVTEGGSCSDNAGLAELWGEVPVATESSYAVEEGGWTAGSGASTALWVPAIPQQRGLSCEYAALSMAMAAFGVDVSEYAFDSIVGWSANPHWGFRGNISGWWGGSDDYGVYAEPLAAAVESFGFWGDAFYANGDAGALTSRLDRGEPTLVWIALLGDQSFVEYAGDGTPYMLSAGQHVVVAYDYDENGVYVADPASATHRFYEWGWFMNMWGVFDGMALAVGPY